MRDWWRYDGGLEIVISFILLLLIVIICIGLIYAEKISCKAKTENINLPSKWTLMGDCQVEVEKDRWIPLNNWYYIEQK